MLTETILPLRCTAVDRLRLNSGTLFTDLRLWQGLIRVSSGFPAAAMRADLCLVPPVLYAPYGRAELLDADSPVRICVKFRVGNEQLRQARPVVRPADSLLKQCRDVPVPQVAAAGDVEALAQLAWGVVAVAAPQRNAIQDVVRAKRLSTAQARPSSGGADGRQQVPDLVRRDSVVALQQCWVALHIIQGYHP